MRVGETIEGSRTIRNRPYPVLKCSSGRKLFSPSPRIFQATRPCALPMCDLIEPSTTMDDLPEECLVHIACQLRSVRDLGAAAQASKLFRDVFYSGAATICPPSRPHLAESASHPPCLPRAHRLCVARPVRRRKTWRVVRLQRECARLVFAPRREADSTRRRCGRRAAVVRIWTAVARGVPHHE